MTVYQVSKQGKVRIPLELRQKYKLKAGAEVSIVDYGGVLAIIPAMQDPVHQAAGMVKAKNKLTEVLLAERKLTR